MVGGRVVYSRVCLGVRVGGGGNLQLWSGVEEWGGLDSCMGS